MDKYFRESDYSHKHKLLKDYTLHPVQELLILTIPNFKEFRDEVIETFSIEEKERFDKIKKKRKDYRSYHRAKKYNNPKITRKPQIPWSLLCEIIELHKNKESYGKIYKLLIQKNHYKPINCILRRYSQIKKLLHTAYPTYLHYNEELKLKQKIMNLHKIIGTKRIIDTRVFYLVKKMRATGMPYRKIDKIVFDRFNKTINSKKYDRIAVEIATKQEEIITKKNALTDKLIELVRNNKRKKYKCPYCQKS